MEKTNKKKKSNFWKKFIAYLMLITMVLSIVAMAVQVLAS